MDFKNYIQNISLQDNDVLVSFDVKSLFTNIPIDIALTEIERRWDEIKNNMKINKEDFIKLLEFCTKENNYFKYEQKFYRQTRLSNGQWAIRCLQ